MAFLIRDQWMFIIFIYISKLLRRFSTTSINLKPTAFNDIKAIRRTSLLAILIFCPLAESASVNPYTLNAGDELSISVWQEPDLKQDVVVLPDGSFSFPLVGQIMAEGYTSAEVEKTLSRKLKKFIPKAVVTVSVHQVSGNKIYIIGEVNKPGEYQLSRPLDVIQALSLAGGLSDFASGNEIIVLRQIGKEKIALPFPYDDVQQGKKLDKNFVLKSGDSIIVPGRSLF